MIKQFIMWLFNIKPEIKYIERTIEKEKELPRGSILIEGDILKIDNIEIGVE